MITTYFLLFSSAILAGALNSVAGGGSFFTFPMLLFTGMNPIIANATNTMATWPGTIASIFAYKKEIHAYKQHIPRLVLTSLLGSALGALVLLKTPEATFSKQIPYLLLLATLLFAFGNSIAHKLREWSGYQLGTYGSFILQTAIAAYGGYFGGGMGMMVLAMFALMGLTNIHQMNALKTVLTTSINGVAVLIFIVSHLIAWPEAIIMLIGAIIGGYGGALYAQKVSADKVRKFVIVTGILLTLYFFFK